MNWMTLSALTKGVKQMNTESIDYGFLQHGAGSSGPFRTEKVRIKLRGYPHTGQWVAQFMGRWRVVHVQLNRTFIVWRGERITIEIEGV